MPIDLSKLTDEQLEAYQSLRSKGPPPTQEAYVTPSPQSIGHGLSEAVSGANPFPGLYQAIRHPIDTAKGLWNAQGSEQAKVPQAFSDLIHSQPGHRLEETANLAQHLIGSVPLVGPPASALIDQIGGTKPEFDRYGNVTKQGTQPDPVGGISRAIGTGIVAPLAIEGAGTMARGISSTPSAMRGLTRVNPKNAIPKVFPGRENAPLIPAGQESFSDLKTFGGEAPKTMFGRPKVGVEQLAPPELSGGTSNVDTAISAMQEKGLEPWMERARQTGVTVPGDRIVAATRAAIPSTMWAEDPEGASALVDNAQRAYGGKRLTVDEARQILAEKNKGSAPFQRATNSRQGTAAVNTTPPAIEDAQSQGVRNALYEALDPEGQGSGPREIQRRTGNQIKLGNAAEGRFSDIMGEKPNIKLGAIAQPAVNAFRALRSGNPTSLFRNIAHPFRGPSDALITDLYRQAPEAAPLPQPAGAYPRLNASRMIGPPSPQLGPSVQGSVSSVGLPAEWQANAWQGIGAPKQLGPGTAPFTQGTSVPDIMGQARTAMGRDINGPRRIEPPNPQRQPIHLPTTQGTYPGELPPTASTPQPMGASGPAMPPSVKTSGIQTPVPRFAPIPYEAPAEENLGIRIDPQTGKLIIRGLQ